MPTTVLYAADLPVPLEEFRLKALAWADQFPLVAYYNPHQIPYPYSGFEHILAVSGGAALPLEQEHAFESLRLALQQQQQLLCGYLAYDLKNQLENLHSNNPDQLGFPLIFFFEPEITFYFKHDRVSIEFSDAYRSAPTATILSVPTPVATLQSAIAVKPRVMQEVYKKKVEQIRKHILEGDVYELNYCIEFFAEQVTLEPLPLYLTLSAVSPTPFGGYLKCESKYLLCASPERFLKKEGSKLISQPIKGTIRRGATPAEDQQLQHQLRHDEKELAENMMIMDLVRNDLRRSCATGTINVEEMFGIYGFRQVSQMITTVTGELREDCDLVDAIKGAFPMGSMTGAPKIRAMQLIDELEDTKRGLYSGAFGYIHPNQDCDFNVVIRSLQYNAATGYLSFMVGSAITFDSDPEKEYAECLLKAQAMMEVLEKV
ncbi:anthranilate synthase component I family protein [Botryobacter ruber]|uniref:anthranilate synthase component I family protein n=1 Tax=Botryobacter ruber TaxID=2171629 RepID=UPI0013E39CD5|nr:anthranilate synthase component I family protein [Botryobacter ruber]